MSHCLYLYLKCKRNEKHHVIICIYFIFSINVAKLLLFFSIVNYMLIYCVVSLVHLFHCMQTEFSIVKKNAVIQPFTNFFKR